MDCPNCGKHRAMSSVFGGRCSECGYIVPSTEPGVVIRRGEPAPPNEWKQLSDRMDAEDRERDAGQQS